MPGINNTAACHLATGRNVIKNNWNGLTGNPDKIFLSRAHKEIKRPKWCRITLATDSVRYQSLEFYTDGLITCTTQLRMTCKGEIVSESKPATEHADAKG